MEVAGSGTIGIDDAAEVLSVVVLGLSPLIVMMGGPLVVFAAAADMVAGAPE